MKRLFLVLCFAGIIAASANAQSLAQCSEFDGQLSCTKPDGVTLVYTYASGRGTLTGAGHLVDVSDGVWNVITPRDQNSGSSSNSYTLTATVGDSALSAAFHYEWNESKSRWDLYLDSFQVVGP